MYLVRSLNKSGYSPNGNSYKHILSIIAETSFDKSYRINIPIKTI